MPPVWRIGRTLGLDPLEYGRSSRGHARRTTTVARRARQLGPSCAAACAASRRRAPRPGERPLSHRPHPRASGAALTHPFLTTDYSESLPEFVTPRPRGATGRRCSSFATCMCSPTGGSTASCCGPRACRACRPERRDPDRLLRRVQFRPHEDFYRRGLGFRYGRSMQAIAGVHFNYSLPSRLLAGVSRCASARPSPRRIFAPSVSWASCATIGAARGSSLTCSAPRRRSANRSDPRVTSS